VGPRTGLDDVVTVAVGVPGLALRPLGRPDGPGRRQSLSWLLILCVYKAQ
jgi:hypothetical protein